MTSQLITWLRLSGVSGVAHRHAVSSKIPDAIAASGAYLRDAHVFSDMQTVFNIWEMPPQGIALLRTSLLAIGM